MLSISEQAALMRLGLRFLRENKCENQWLGPIPTEEDIDKWQQETIRQKEQDILIHRRLRDIRRRLSRIAPDV